MSNQVWIPINPTQYESEYWVVYRDVQRRELLEWINERNIPHTYEFIKCLYEGIHTHVLNFEKSSDAVLFKLTFGGVKPVVRSHSLSYKQFLQSEIAKKYGSKAGSRFQK